MKFWKTIIALAAACFAGGLGKTTGQETPTLETLEVHYTDSGGTFHTLQVEKDIEVYGFNKPKITMKVWRNGIDVRCCDYEGILQSAPTINGPWKDVQPVRVHTPRVRRDFRSSLPAEFFRVKP